MRSNGAVFTSRRPGIPLVLIDLVSGNRWDLSGRPEWFRIYPDQYHAGRIVGSYLVKRGFSRPALFSPASLQSRWVNERYRGLQDGVADKITSVSLNVLTTVPAQREEEFEFQKSRTSFIKERKLMSRFVNHHLRANAALFKWENRFSQAKPIFDKVAREKRDCWVCLNDDVAVMAYHFFRARKRRLPLVSFDNGPLSRLFGITSYDFAFGKVGRLALNCLLSGIDSVRQTDQEVFGGWKSSRTGLKSLEVST